ncbi:tripartite tricarboxylate transporter substrate binding protein [Burkholderia sp. L27(2015)]|uniref:Bug family tripartite tricarboxylate transporter substrate binding protein n=1 Tax=Burkholderia sp. L27(2015) TaxID=1641858 RepID=UPI00131B9672|nr:tripartite tricarboxylate transporter substrate binding protein [Burkholderia sp. L27(2015)]
MTHVRAILLLCAALCCCGSVVAVAQEYPNKPVRIVVGFSAGGSGDTVARMLARNLGDLWGQSVIVDNRPGAGGLIGANLVAKAPPDGYTLLLGDISTNAIAASLYTHLPFDPINDFVQVTRLVTFPLVLVVPTSSSITSLKDLIAQAKAKPGMLRYSSAGVGTSPHVFIEMMNQMAGINTEAIQYKGAAPAIMGLMSGDVEFSESSASTAQAQIQAGKLRGIAVTGPRALPALPGVPPVSSVVPGYDAVSFHGLHAPAKTPPEIVAKLQRDVATVMHRPEVTAYFNGLSMDVAVMSTADYTAFIKQQTELWRKVTRTANMHAD